MKKWYWYVILAVITLTVYILPIGGRPMLNPDESRYAEVPREMIETGNYISPRLNGVRYFEKTPLSYWCFAASFKLFGMNRFALRLPCMLAMLGTAWIVFLLMSRYYERRTALLGTGIFATLPFVYVLGTVAVTDMFLTFFVTAAMAAYFLAVQNQSSMPRRCGLLFLCGIFCGLAFLTKGFIAFAVPVITIVPYLLWERKWKMLFTTPWLPLLGAVLTVLPWGLAIHQQEPDFWHYFFFVEHINRFFGQEKAQHSNHFFYFFPVFIGGIAPWVLMTPDICKSLYRQVKNSPLLKFCCCAVVLPFLFFSCSSGKLATYILPCFAPVSILFAAALEKFFVEEKRERAFHLTLLVLAIGFPGAAVVMTVNALTGFPRPLFLAEDWRQLLLLAAVSLMCLLVFYLAWSAKTSYTKLFLLLISLLPVLVGTNCIFPAIIREKKAPICFLEDAAKRVPKENVVIVTSPRPFQDVCWSFKNSKVKLFGGRNEIAYGLSYPEAKDQFIQNPDELKALYRQVKQENKTLVLISKIKDLPNLKKNLPEPRKMETSRPGHKDGYAVLQY